MNSRQKQKSITIPVVTATTSGSRSTSSYATPNNNSKPSHSARMTKQQNNQIAQYNKTFNKTSNQKTKANNSASRANIFNTKTKQNNFFESTSGPFKGGANFMASHMQQMETIPGNNKTAPVSNAPTSLTNLAQLSGITFLPPRSSATLPKMIINKPSATQIKSITPTNLMRSDRKQQLINNLSKNSPHDINTISSVQLLNQTSLSMPAQNNCRKVTTNTLSRTESNKKNNIQQTIGNNNTINGNKNNKRQYKVKQTKNPKTNQRQTKTYARAKNLNNDQFQVIQTNEPLAMFSSPSGPAHADNVDDIFPHTSQESISYQAANNYNDEMNNISLMKLMAILNNPALTITPVTPNYNNQSPNTSLYSTMDNFQTSTMNSYDSSHPISITALPRKNNRIQDSGVVISSGRSGQKKKSVNDLINEESLYQQFDRSSIVDVPINGNYSDLSESQILEPTDIQLDWLEEYSQKNVMNNYNSNSHKNQSVNNDKTTSGQDHIVMSTSVKNLMMQALPSTSKEVNTVSVQLLNHVPDKSHDNNWNNSTNIDSTSCKSIVEQECILSTPKSIHQLRPGVKISKSCDIVTIDDSSPKKEKKRILRTTQSRLYLPEDKSDKPFRKKLKMIDEIGNQLKSIRIIRGEEKEVYLSEQNFILDSMMRENTDSHKKSAILEPDDIFINRSKRIMSKIDTMIERKKRRRFERISSRADPKNNRLEDQYEESENEWSDDEDNTSFQSTFIPIQLPLDEIVSEDKKEHLFSVGLVSREEKNRLLLKRAEEKVNLVSPIIMECSNEVSPDLRRFVDTIVQTGGGIDVQMRINSDIKRNELPLIEGLNRNTSRLKMNFMNTLGLEKRSKRTTLYRVKQNDVNIASNNSTNDSSQGQIDYNSKKKVNSYEKKKVDQLVDISKSLTSITNKLVANGTTISRVNPKLELTSCRNTIKPPNKDEYMKSLGLMAS